jgi:hypothetical protein
MMMDSEQMAARRSRSDVCMGRFFDLDAVRILVSSVDFNLLKTMPSS